LTRIVHLSDLHCPAFDPAQAEVLRHAVNAATPDVIVITGDVTRAGRRREFAAAHAFAAKLAAPVIAVPGNHDVPVFDPGARTFGPFSRFSAVFPGNVYRDDTLVIAGFNTARALSLSWNWSLGHVDRVSLNAALRACAEVPTACLRILASHHPLLRDPYDPARSYTRGGRSALAEAARGGVRAVLHGHLHATRLRKFTTSSGTVLSIGAGTPLSDRERGTGSSFNLIDIENDHLRISEMRWTGSAYPSHTLGLFALRREQAQDGHVLSIREARSGSR
jgi:3',5'-cyclic AMP phosphodiesterase CpdA